MYGQNQYMQNGMRHKVRLIHQPVDPYTDIAPQRGYSVQIRHVTQRAGGTDHRYQAACCYGPPDGRCVAG